MSDYEDLLKNYTSKAGEVILPLQRDLASGLGVRFNAEAEEKIGAALARAFMGGVTAGEAEVMAQAVEQGYDVTSMKLRAEDPEGDEGGSPG